MGAGVTILKSFCLFLHLLYLCWGGEWAYGYHSTVVSRTSDGTRFSRPCGFQVLNSDLQAWQQALLSVGSSCWPPRGYSFKEGKEGRHGWESDIYLRIDGRSQVYSSADWVLVSQHKALGWTSSTTETESAICLWFQHWEVGSWKTRSSERVLEQPEVHKIPPLTEGETQKSLDRAPRAKP